MIAWILGSVLVPIAVEAAGAYVTPGTGTAVYDNSEMVQFAGAGCTSSNEFGNEVLLAPAGADGSRTIGSIHVPFFCYSKDPKAPLGFLRFRLYHNNGPGEGSDHPPGDILLDSGPVQAALGKDYNTLVLDGLRLTNVPNRVTWTVEFTGVSATVTMQLLLIEPPVLGHAFDECWVKRPAGWRTQRFLEDLNPLWAVKPVFALRMEALTDAREPSVSVARGAPVPPWTPPVPPYTVLYPDLFVDGADTNRLTPTYPLSLDSASPGYGRVEIEPYVAAEYPLGTVLTLTAVPAPGCTFESWSGDVAGAANPIQWTVGTNNAIGARFSAQPAKFSSVRLQDGKTVLEWEGSAMLQSSTSPAGPWTDIALARSPYTVSYPRALEFFRLQSGFGY